MFGLDGLGARMDFLVGELHKDMTDGFVFSTLRDLGEHQDRWERQVFAGGRRIVEERPPDFQISEDAINQQMNFCLDGLVGSQGYEW